MPPVPGKEGKPKKSKSSTNLAAVFGKSKSSKALKLDKQPDGQQAEKDKENRNPRAYTGGAPPPPIWAQFATTQVESNVATQKVPLNDRWDIANEMYRYTPQDYSPSKGRNFYDEQPTLSKRVEPKPRPKSAYFPSSTSSSSFTDTISALRKVSQRYKKTDMERVQDSDKPPSRRSSTSSRKTSNDSSQPALTMGKRGSRVMGLVAALNGKAKDTEPEAKQPVPVDPKAIDQEFEAVLVGLSSPIGITVLTSL
jgi:hypothetical protein